MLRKPGGPGSIPETHRRKRSDVRKLSSNLLTCTVAYEHRQIDRWTYTLTIIMINKIILKEALYNKNPVVGP